ncbi:MAG TPA: ABC transporter substrate-binding protein [Chloroflexota bacterium]|nr:ABC transporter substrate-binding protein [Chloroflexota bacterium]
MTEALNVVYRSRRLQYPLLAAMNACDAWQRAGVELRSLKYVSGAAQSDPMLVRGECDFIFGSHISPYIHRFHGQPFVYLGQTVNWADDVLVSREPLAHAKDLEGKRVCDRNGLSPTNFGSNHSAGNHLLYLLREGVDLAKVEFVSGPHKEHYKNLLEGIGDVAFASPPYDEEALAAGLHVLRLAPLPMVNSSTMTTLWPVVRERPALCEAVLKAVILGIHFIKTQPDAFWKLVQNEVAGELEIDDERVLKHLHRYSTSIMEPRLYPTADAVANAYKLAVIQEPAVAGMNPMSLWDVHLLRSIEESEFIDDLYGGQVPGPGAVPSRN